MPSPFDRNGFPFFSRFLRDETPVSTAVALLVCAALTPPLGIPIALLLYGAGDGPPEPGAGMGAMVMSMGPREEAPGGAMGRNAGSLADPLGLCDVPCEADIREAVQRSAGTGVRGPLSTTRAVLEDMIPVPSASTPILPPCAPILRTEQPRKHEPETNARAVSSCGDANVVRAAVDSSPPQLGTPKPSPAAREVHSVSSGEPCSVAGGWGVICEGVPDEDDTDCEFVDGEDSFDGRAADCAVPHVRVPST